jgi:hypothetical protein
MLKYRRGSLSSCWRVPERGFSQARRKASLSQKPPTSEVGEEMDLPGAGLVRSIGLAPL